jgi:Asp-tRNA(Asn)/Glu-tRNA(Gln) amidotransferase A subunit family amidase
MSMAAGGEGKAEVERPASAKRGLLRQFVEWLESRSRTPHELLQQCLKRIAEGDAQLRAWVKVSPQPALGSGPLNGIPFGAKDIFETSGMATEYGSPIYAGRKGSDDAALVIALRERGAVLVGKTQTTAFASFDPAPTRNPHDTLHTPGGSSSGSAVAVAAGMVPFALGTQTLGSVLRPASFCAVVGFKPSLGLLPLAGILPFAPSLDTAGLFTQTADDMQLLWTRMGHAEAPHARVVAVPSLLPQVEPVMEAAFRRTVERLSADFAFQIVEMPSRFADLTPAVQLIYGYEGARTHQARWREHGRAIGEKLAQLVDEGWQIPEDEYLAALATVANVKREMSGLLREYAALATPSALGPAPAGLASTGDPIMNLPWTALGVPAISIPMPTLGLPLGLQLVSENGRDSALLALAAEVEARLS